MAEDLSGNVERFMGFAEQYDAYRPTPPSVIVDMLTQAAGGVTPKLVVDLGCGTGLSSRIWAGRAAKVAGVEPSSDMRGQAELGASEMTTDTEFEFREGLSSQTGLPDGCADIVTCSQALHWMEPVSTFVESARILRKGGVFAAIDCDWPPLVNVETALAHREAARRIDALCDKHGVSESVTKWSKNKHLDRIKESGRFRYVREILAHSIEQGDADRFVGLMLSMGSLQSLLKLGLTEGDLGITTLREAVIRTIGVRPCTWYFSYRVRMGVK